MAEWGGEPPAPAAAMDPDVAVAMLSSGLAIFRRSASQLLSFHLHLDGGALVWSEKALGPGSPVGPTCTAELVTTRIKVCTANPLEFELLVGDGGGDGEALRLRVGDDEEMAVVRTAWAAAVGAHAVSTAELPNLHPDGRTDDELRDDIAQVLSEGLQVLQLRPDGVLEPRYWLMEGSALRIAKRFDSTYGQTPSNPAHDEGSWAGEACGEVEFLEVVGLWRGQQSDAWIRQRAASSTTVAPSRCFSIVTTSRLGVLDCAALDGREERDMIMKGLSLLADVEIREPAPSVRPSLTRHLFTPAAATAEAAASPTAPRGRYSYLGGGIGTPGAPGTPGRPPPTSAVSSTASALGATAGPSASRAPHAADHGPRGVPVHLRMYAGARSNFDLSQRTRLATDVGRLH